MQQLFVQVSHQPGKPEKVGEFDSGQGKIRETGKSQGKCVCLCCVTSIAMVTE